MADPGSIEDQLLPARSGDFDINRRDRAIEVRSEFGYTALTGPAPRPGLAIIRDSGIQAG